MRRGVIVDRMRRVLLLLCAGLALPPAAHAATGERTGALLVTLAPGAATAQPQASGARAMAAAARARPAGFSVPQIRLVTLRPRPGESLRALKRRLEQDPRVQSVEPEHRARLRYIPNDPALVAPETAPDTAPGTTVEWWAARTGFPAAWDISRGVGSTVAVIDTGADISHPELAGRVQASATFDAARTPPGVDVIGHGTHVASIACAAGDNGVGMTGAGLGCRLLVVKSDFTDSSIAASIVWAVDNGADAINMSFGTAAGTVASTALSNAIDYAVAHRVVLVAAAADEAIDDQGSPANALQPAGTGPDITQGRGLVVTAVDFADRRAGFAGRGTQISIAAYGAYDEDDDDGPPGIFGASTTAPNALDTGALGQRPCRCRATFAGDSRYAYLQGTSMAAPMVSAAAALIRHLNPDLGALEIARILKQTARRPAPGWSPDLGWGILDAGTALGVARTIDRRPPESRIRRTRSRTRRPSITLRWRGADVPRPGVAVSGLARFQLWRSVDGRPAAKILATRRTSARVRLRRGSRYAFYTTAVDVAGNVEPAPAVPDVRITVPRR
jgi:serine protease